MSLSPSYDERHGSSATRDCKTVDGTLRVPNSAHGVCGLHLFPNRFRMIAAVLASLVLTQGAVAADAANEFRVWATSCSHVPAESRRGRESLAKAIRQSEGREPGAPGIRVEHHDRCGGLVGQPDAAGR